MQKKKVPSMVKDEQLIQIRREQLIKGAVKLFKEKGFHPDDDEGNGERSRIQHRYAV